MPKGKSHKGYAESVSGRSLRSDRSKRHRSRSRKSSSGRRHHEFPHNRSDKKGHVPSSSTREEDDDGHPGPRKDHHHHRSSKHDDDDDDRHKDKSDRKESAGSKRPLENYITLAIVDPDEVSSVTFDQAMEQPPSSGSKAWHG